MSTCVWFHRLPIKSKQTECTGIYIYIGERFPSGGLDR